MKKRISLLLLPFLALQVFLQAALCAPSLIPPKFKDFESNGDPLIGGLVYTCEPGTSTKKTTYSDPELATSNDNPLVLDSRGETSLYFNNATKIKLSQSSDTDSPTSSIWTMDSVFTVNNKNIGYFLSAYDDLASAISDIGSTETVLIIDTNGVLAEAASQSIPSTLTLKFIQGNTIDGTAGGSEETLKINGIIEAGVYQIFGSNLNVAGSPIVDTIYPQWWGVAGDGTTDDSTEIIAAHSGNKVVKYKSGTYLFTSATNPTLTKGVEMKNATWKSTTISDILVLDSDSNTLVGLHHNHREEDETDLGSNLAITAGTLVAPPYSKASPSNIDLMAHWYNNNGLDYVRNGNGGAPGNLKWYYWDWNFTDSGTYDAQRHPLIGWYRGDDANVLDWQCYWLREYGINTTILAVTADVQTTNWSTATDKHHWLYELFTNAENFQGMKYMLWGAHAVDGARSIQDQWDEIIDNIYLKYPNFHTVNIGGKLYASIYVFEASSLSTNLGGAAAFKTFMGVNADKFIAAGLDGIALFSRHPGADVTIGYDDLEDVNVFQFVADYGASGALLTNGATSYTIDESAVTFEALVNSWTPYQNFPAWENHKAYDDGDHITHRGWLFEAISNHTSGLTDEPNKGDTWASKWYRYAPLNRLILGIATSKHASVEHTTFGADGWLAAGSTPALYRKWLEKAVNKILTDDLPRMLTVYNVAEWAEGGPGLQPNKKDGFGYLKETLDVVRNLPIVESVSQ